MTILAIDAGTTGVTVLLVDHSAHVISHGYREFAQHFPENGWVEHDPGEIWQATLAAARDCLSAAPGHSPIAI
jgi:glycerol kinase